MFDTVVDKKAETGSVGLQADVNRLSRKATLLAQEGKHREAQRVWQELNCILPDHQGVATGLAASLLASRDYKQAHRWLLAACHRFPNDARLLRFQGHALHKLGKHREAIGALCLSLEIDPADAETHADLATSLHADRQFTTALSHAAIAHATAPRTATAAIIAETLLDQGRSRDAMTVVEAALAADVEVPSMLLLKSLCLRAVGDAEGAFQCSLAALDLAPNDDGVRAWAGMALLSRGHFTKQAWQLYESRSIALSNGKWPNPELRWNGQDVRGKTIFVHSEQGLGDTINFIRYVPMLAAQGARVIVAVQASLHRLLRQIDGAQEVTVAGSHLPKFDYYVPLLSLPGLFGTTVETIPPPIPLAIPNSERHFISADGRVQVGLAWAGGAVFSDDRRRSIDPALLRPLAEVPGVRLHSLQYGAAAFPSADMNNLVEGSRDFVDTAQRIQELDLVITVDTSVAHLAATLGKPVWMLSRQSGCWRWLQEREDTPWYPTMRIYRQQTYNDWGPVVSRVKDDLEALATCAGSSFRHEPEREPAL